MYVFEVRPAKLRLLKSAIPLVALTVVVPVKLPPEVVTLILSDDDVTVLLEESWTTIFGPVVRALPDFPATGEVCTANLFAVPAMYVVSDAPVKEVAE